MLEVFMFHEHACEAMEDALLDLVDYCCRKVVWLIQRWGAAKWHLVFAVLSATKHACCCD